MLGKNNNAISHSFLRNNPLPLALANEEPLLKYYLSLSDFEREKKFAPPSSACKLVGRSPRTIQRWIEAGFIRAVYIVGRYQVEIASLKSFVQEQAHSHST